ncbi:MAG: MYXO-CTERM sorting domain-containing protein [Polyangiaceae bacterium]
MNRRARIASLAGAVAVLTSLPASAAVIQVSPADGNTAYTKIEGAVAGDEVVIAPGTYAFRVYLQAQGTASQPIYIHAQDPSNPPVWDLSGTLVEDAPGSYTAPDKNRGCWQVSGGTNYHIDGIVFENCHAGDYDSAGLRYYSGTTGLLITNCLFQDNDNGLTGGTESSDATVEFSEFSQNGNLGASTSSPTHNVYIYGGTFAMRYSYLHDPLQAENLHCRAVSSTIEYNWFDRAKVYEGDLMTSDDYANNPVGSLAQTMILRGNVIIETAAQSNQSQIWAVYNDEASGSPVSFSITALYNTVVSDGGHGAFIHVSNADGTQMTAEADDNIISGTSQPILVEDSTAATVTGKNNWLQTGASLTGLSGVTGSIFGAAAGFTNAATYDFSLAAGSPCIGVADTAVGNLPVDEYYENETVTRMYRVRASALDLGAFEHTTTGPGIGPYGSDGGVAVAPDAGSADAGAVDATVGDAATPPEGDGGASPSDAEEPVGADEGQNMPGGGDGGGAAGGHTGSSGGCGCRVMQDGAGDGFAALALAGLGAAMIRRRRRR